MNGEKSHKFKSTKHASVRRQSELGTSFWQLTSTSWSKNVWESDTKNGKLIGRLIRPNQGFLDLVRVGLVRFDWTVVDLLILHFLTLTRELSKSNKSEYGESWNHHLRLITDSIDLYSFRRVPQARDWTLCKTDYSAKNETHNAEINVSETSFNLHCFIGSAISTKGLIKCSRIVCRLWKHDEELKGPLGRLLQTLRTRRRIRPYLRRA